MAITERYVTTTGAGAHDGTSEANAFSWTEMVTDINTPRVGYRYNVQKGTYNLSATDTLTGDGTQASGNCIRGYHQTIGDLDNVGRTSEYNDLDVTNYPTIAYGSTFRFNGSGADYLLLQNLVFTGTVSNPVVSLGVNGTMVQVKITNSSTNSNGRAFTSAAAGSVLVRCDLACDGASGPLGCLDVQGNTAINIDVRILDCPNAAALAPASAAIFIGCVFGKDVDGVCIDFTSGSTTSVPPIVVNCTSYSAGSSFYRGANTNFARSLVVVNNHVTDAGAYFIDSQYNTTANLHAVMVANRTRDLTSGVSRGFDDWATLTTIGHVASIGSVGSDYTDAGNGDLSLVTSAPGRGVGVLGNDMGAITKQASSSSTAYVIGG